MSRPPRVRWHCVACDARELEPCRLVGHLSERLVFQRDAFAPTSPRQVVEAVEIANGVALVPR